ncbi:hypothetical protein CMO96_04940 [Candidatus Woesebacteria bacterium]|nr:hypothetical protein [Candidatus Woesebacteria bacterium]
MHAATAKIVGANHGQMWTQVHSFSPQDEDKKQEHGEIVAAIALKGGEEAVEKETGSVEIGREVLTRLHEEYFGKTEGSPFDRLKSSLVRVSQEFPLLGVEIAALVIWGNYAYFCILGRGSVYLKRDGKLIQLLSGSGQDVVSLSGTPQVGDIFLFGTEGFFQAVPPASLGDILSDSQFQDVADSLVAQVHKRDDVLAAAGLVRIGQERDEGHTDELPPLDKGKVVVEKILGLKSVFPGFIKNRIHFLASKLPEKQIHIRHNTGPSRRTTVFIGVVLLLLLSVSIIFGTRQKDLLNYRSSYEDRLTQARNDYQDALLQKDIDSLRAKELFLQSKELAGILKSEGVEDPQLDELIKGIEDNTSTLLGLVEAQTGVFLDLSLVRSGVAASEIVLHEEDLAVLDRAGDRIFSISAENKETTVVAGAGKLGRPSVISLYGGRYFSFGDRGIIEVDKRGGVDTIADEDEDWGAIIKIGAFGGNLYLVSQSGEIWRYPAIDDGFGAKQKWFGKGVTPDLTDTVDLAIDGSIWILASSGKISKFTRGAPERFSISGMDEDLAEPKALYTDETLESVFILDRAAGRIVEVDKKGDYKKQYKTKEVAEARDFVVSTSVGKIFLLTETKILEIALQ